MKLELQKHLTIGKQIVQVLEYYDKVTSENMANACDEHEYDDAEYYNGRIQDLLDKVNDPTRKTVGFQLNQEEALFLQQMCNNLHDDYKRDIEKRREQMTMLNKVSGLAMANSKEGFYII